MCAAGVRKRDSVKGDTLRSRPRRRVRSRSCSTARRHHQSEFLGYCGVCGGDVETDFCYACGRYVEEEERI